MRRNKIKRRTPAQTLKIQFERGSLSYDKLAKFTNHQRKLLIAGLMLYWAEGSKANKFTVDFANSDEKMLRLFIRMLREIYRVTEKRLRIYLYCYLNQDVNKIIDFWSKKLKVPKGQFSKPYIRKDFKIEKIGKMPFGLVHIRYSDKKLHRQIMTDIGIISSSLLKN
jgi:hypothetical protein